MKIEMVGEVIQPNVTADVIPEVTNLTSRRQSPLDNKDVLCSYTHRIQSCQQSQSIRRENIIMDFIRTDWKTIERDFARHVAMGYRSMWKILEMKCDDRNNSTIDDFRIVESYARKHGAENYIAKSWEEEKRLMKELANDEPEFVQLTSERMLAKSFQELLAYNIDGLREFKGRNRKIVTILKELSKRPHLQEDALDFLKKKMANLNKLAYDVTVVLACLDQKLESLPKIRKETTFVLHKMASVTIKVLKSFGRKRSARDSETSHAENAGSCDELTLKEEYRSRSVASTSSQFVNASNEHDSPRTGDLRETGDSAPQGDGPRPAGSFPKIITVKPLDADEDDDFNHLGEFENMSDGKKEVRPINVHRNNPESDWKEKGKTDHGEEFVNTALQATKASPVDNLPGMIRKFAWSEEPSSNPEVTLTSTNKAAAERERMASLEDAPATQVPLPLGEMYEIYVRVVQKYKAKNENELSLKVGQIIKQKLHADPEGYAYGWTRAHRLAPKRWGKYPVDCVQLKSQGKQ